MRRQAEIAQLIDVLKRFQPTKIAVEVDTFPQKRIAQRYDDYLAGKYQLTRNEIDQLGLRLAKELGHKTIYAVDADGDFPWLRVVNFAKASGRSNGLDAMIAEGDWAGADLLADWFKRNIRIYANIGQLVSPGDRVVVIFGSGHVAWMWTDIGANPDLRLRKLAEFVK